MRDHSIFGETQCGQPVFNPSAGARTQKGAICHGLFGTKLFPEDEQAPGPEIGPGRIAQTLS